MSDKWYKIEMVDDSAIVKTSDNAASFIYKSTSIAAARSPLERAQMYGKALETLRYAKPYTKHPDSL